MQNGADILEDQSEQETHQTSPNIQITEAEISVENIKHSKQISTGTENSAIHSTKASNGANIPDCIDVSTPALCLSQKGSKNDAASTKDTPMAEPTEILKESAEKKSDDQGEKTLVEVNNSAEKEMDVAVSEDDTVDEDNIDNIGADDTVVEPYMQGLVKPDHNKSLLPKKKRGRPSKKSVPTEEEPKNVIIEEPPKKILPEEPVTNPIVEELPKKIATEEKIKKRVGRPRKVLQDEAAKPCDVAPPGGETGDPAAAGQNVEVDLFTYVPGRTSEPIQLSAVSSVVSGSDIGSAASLDEENKLDKIPEEEKEEGTSTEDLKKLLKSKLLKKTSPSSDKSRKRKSANEKEPQGKFRKVASHPPAEDSSSLQKKQDMINFLDDTKKVLSQQETGVQMEIQSDLEEARAAALMAKGPCLDLDEDDLPIQDAMLPVKTKKVRGPYKKRITKNQKNFSSLVEIATVSKSFESLNTKDLSESVPNGESISQDVLNLGDPTRNRVVGTKVGRPRKYRKKNTLAALKSKWSRKKSPIETVAVVHEVPTGLSQDSSVPEIQTGEIPAVTDSNVVSEVPQNTHQEVLPEKRLKKTSKHRSPRYRRKKFHNWNKKKRHTPAVLMRLANQMKALQAAKEMAMQEEAHRELNPEIVPVEQPPPQVFPTTSIPKKRRSYTKKSHQKFSNISEVGWESVSDESFLHETQLAKRGPKKSLVGKVAKKSSPIVRISPLSNKKNNNESAQSQFGLQVSDEPPVLTRISNIEANQTGSNQMNPDLDPQFGDQHSDMSSSSKRSYLKPKDADEFEKDTGAVSLKNILPGRRSMDSQRHINSSLEGEIHGSHSIVKQGQIRKNYAGRGYKKKYGRGGMTVLKQNVYKMEGNSLPPSHQFQSTPVSEFDSHKKGGNFYDKLSHHPHSPRSREKTEHRRQSREYFSNMDMNYTPPNHQHRPRERGHQRGDSTFHRQSSGGHKHSFSEDNDPPSSTERNSSRSHTDSPNRKGVIGSTVGAVISQLFGDEIPRLAPGSGYVINVRLDVERKEATGTKKSHKSVSTQEDLDGERRRHSSHHSTSREKSTHVSSTVNSYTRKSQSSDPQPSTSAAPDEPPPREAAAPLPRISDVDLCAMLEERISSRHGLRVDVRDNLLDNIKHVERVLKESS